MLMYIMQFLGSLVLPDKASPGRWKVEGTLIGGDYFIIALGKINKDGLYPWAVISSPFKINLYVLVRDVDLFYEKYNKFLLKYLSNNGFDREYNKPLQTYHGPDCLYAK